MNDPDGRYANLSLRVMASEDGKPISYLERRFVLSPDSATILGEVTTEAEDRLDLVSSRMLGQPGQWWSIADAHRIIHPEELEKPAGQRLRIAMPGSQTGEGDV